MSAFRNKDSKIIVQGFKAVKAPFMLNQMIGYGTIVVVVVTPVKVGQGIGRDLVFNTVEEGLYRKVVRYHHHFCSTSFC